MNEKVAEAMVLLQKENELKEAKLAEERRKTSDAQKPQGDVQTQQKPEPVAVKPETTQKKSSKVYTLQFEVDLTREQMFELKDFFELHKIAYRKIG